MMDNHYIPGNTNVTTVTVTGGFNVDRCSLIAVTVNAGTAIGNA